MNDYGDSTPIRHRSDTRGPCLACRHAGPLNPDPLYVLPPPDPGLMGDEAWRTPPRRRDFALLLAAAGVIALILLVASPILTRVL